MVLAHSRVRRWHELRVRQRLLRYIDPSLCLVDTWDGKQKGFRV